MKNDLENKTKDLGNHLNNYDQRQKYYETKSEIEKIYEKFVEGAKARSKCTWYEEGEKSTKFFVNLEKKSSSRANSKTHYWQPRNYGSK